jgi:uracil-DNA glycosylase
MSQERSKQVELEALRKEILSRVPDAWLFPSEGNVRGFMGASSVMFVAERPSTAVGFGGPGRSFLYPLLEETGNADAHLTDIIKTRAKVGAPYPEEIALHRHFFDRELRIVRPHLIIAFGQKVYDLLQFALAGSGITIRQVWHYSYPGRWPRKRVAFKAHLLGVLGDAGLRSRGPERRSDCPLAQSAGQCVGHQSILIE